MSFFDNLIATCEGVTKALGGGNYIRRMILNGYVLTLHKANGEYLGKINDVRAVMGCGDKGVVVVHTDGTYGFYDIHGCLKGGLLSREEYFAVKEKMGEFFNSPEVRP